MPKISFKNVSYVYRSADEEFSALQDINLDIEEGELVCLVGHSGCGKSTMLSLLAGLLKPTNGEVLIDGVPVEKPGLDRSIVFQNYSLFPWQTAQKNVAFAIRQAHKSTSKKQAMEHALDLLEQVNIKEAAARYPFQLSGGMRQRVAIAKALGIDAPIMLLDEPFGALDPLIRKQLQLQLLQLWNSSTGNNQGEASKRKTAVFVTHDIDEAMYLADRIVFMKPKHIVKSFNLREAKSKCSKSTENFKGTENTSDFQNIEENKELMIIKSEVLALFDASANETVYPQEKEVAL